MHKQISNALFLFIYLHVYVCIIIYISNTFKQNKTKKKKTKMIAFEKSTISFGIITTYIFVVAFFP